MQYISKNPLVKPPEKKWAQFKGTGATVAALCIVCTVFFASLLASGCNEKEDLSKMDEAAFLESLVDAPEALTAKVIFPEWLQKKLESLWESYVINPIPKSKLLIYSCDRDNSKIYYLWYSTSSDHFLFYREDGTKLPIDQILSETNDWKLVYQIEDGVIASFGEKIMLAPVVLASIETLPEWLQAKIVFFETGGGTGITQPFKAYRGIWNGRVTYYLDFWSGCGMCDVFFESGERIDWANYGGNSEKFCSESKEWTLIFLTSYYNFLLTKSVLSDIGR